LRIFINLKTFSFLKILKSNYFCLIIVLAICYTLSYTSFKILARVDYIIIVYLLFMDKFDNDNIIQYALIFGLFYDFLTDSMIGINILFFIMLILFQFIFNYFVSISNYIFRLIFAFTIIVIFNFYNMFIMDLVSSNYIMHSIIFIVTDIVLYLLISSILEFIRVFSIN